MKVDEAIKLLKEMKENCIDKGKTYYEDDKRVKKAEALGIVIKTLEYSSGIDKIQEEKREMFGC